MTDAPHTAGQNTADSNNAAGQDVVIDFLSDPAIFGDGSEGGPGGEQGPEERPVERIETHVSLVFLGAERVLKLKRAVVFPYLDFSTPDRRRLACEAEVRINRRTAPTIYNGVVAVTREKNGGLALGGEGEAVDWLVDMARFDEDTLFDRLAQKGGLDRTLMEDLADSIAAFHHNAEVSRDEGMGGRAGIGMILKSNDECFDGARDVLERADTETLTRLSLKVLDEIGPLLDRRRDLGRVRHCHGDLHLRNICMVEGGPTLFDAIEFNPAFSTIDVLYDLAFLLMDLDHRGLPGLANIVFNRYLDITGDGAERAGGLRVMALFLSMRAAIRCHVDAAQVEALSDPEQAERRAGEAGEYLKMALCALTPGTPRLIGVGGLSGSGKSRMARELAPHLDGMPGARVVRSDATRKRLAGARLQDRLGSDGYTPEMTERTFEALFDEAQEGLRAGRVVIADAVFANPRHRRALSDIAEREDVEFKGLWLATPPDVMAERVAKRKRNISDADAAVLEMQLGCDLGEMTWTRIDSSGRREETLKAGWDVIGAK